MLKNDVNFGDAVSDIFFSKLSDKKIKAVDINYGKDSYLTTGSILRLCNKNHTVIGSGFISDDDDLGKGDWKTYTNKVYNVPKKILSVRGPKTRAKLKAMGVDCPESYGDPLTIFPLVYKKKMSIKYKIGIIPHYVDQESTTMKELVDKLGKDNVKIINIKTGKNFENFIDSINECDTLIVSTLHGLIISLAYLKPVIWVQFSKKLIGDTFKFEDFFGSLGINYNLLAYDDPNLLNNTIKVEKTNLYKLGENIINVCPFIEKNRKNLLKNMWSTHVYN
jgi:hypothetical protein